jgi:hypothetical protein
MKHRLRIDGMDYDLDVTQSVSEPATAPRLVVVSYLPNQTAVQILRVCIATIQKFTAIPYELWVIDNHSPPEYARFLATIPDINVVYNHRTPTPVHKQSWQRRLYERVKRLNRPRRWGSYANGVALEIAARLIDPQSLYFMTLHMDVMPCRRHWLSFLLGKLKSGLAAAGVRMDTRRTPEGVLHVLGCLIDFQLFMELNLSFMPELPQYDVGDKTTVELRRHGHEVYACRNTIWDAGLIEQISMDSPFRHFNVDRALDDQGRVIFLHLGRGIRKSSEEYGSGMSAQEWLNFAEKHLLAA